MSRWDARSWEVRTWPDHLTRAVLIAGFLFMLAVTVPGHLSFDSIAQLHEGHFQIRRTWAPVMYAWVLGFFDRIVPGTGLYVVASGFLLLASLLSLRGLRPRISWLAPVVALSIVASPLFLIYQGIVWKDVLLANLVIAAFTALAHAANGWNERRNRLWLAALAALFLAVGALVRQNGGVVIPFAALALAWCARGGGWRRMLAWGGGFLIATLILAKALDWAVEPKAGSNDVAIDRGVTIVQRYDIVGALAHDPNIPLGRLAAADPKYEKLVREMVAYYSPQRVDTFMAFKPAEALWFAPKDAVPLQWREIIVHHPGAYLAHRMDVFRWLVLPPVQEACLPVHVGVMGPANRSWDLGIVQEEERRDRQLANYATWFYYTPVMSHLAYGLLALAVLGLTMLRRDPADYVIAAMMVGALCFAATFFVISLACDYRYLYMLDMAALAGLFYLAVDPPWPSLRRLLSRVRRPAR